MARYSFSGTIPPKSEDKIRHYKERFRKIATTIVLDKDENLWWSGVQWHRSWHRGNEMMPLPISLIAVFLGTGTVLPKSFTGAFLSNSRLDVREVRKAKSLRTFYRYIFEWSTVRNTEKNGQSWWLAVICRKQSAFDMLFYLTVVSIFLKTCVKDHEDSSSRLQERRIWLVCIEALNLLEVFVKISVYFNELASNF